MNRVVMITGATRGIGFATAAEFLKHCDKVAILSRHKEHGIKAKNDLASSFNPDNILALAGNVRKEKDVKRLVGQCRENQAVSSKSIPENSVLYALWLIAFQDYQVAGVIIFR